MRVIFIDGDCILCNNLLKIIDRYDGKNLFRFSSLQSEYSKTRIQKKTRQQLNTLVLIDEDKYYYKSEAIFVIVKNLDFPIRLFYFLNILPVFISNFFYDVISKNRHRIFKNKVCEFDSTMKNKFLS